MVSNSIGRLSTLIAPITFEGFSRPSIFLLGGSLLL
jgi:hypothetical protein